MSEPDRQFEGVNVLLGVSGGVAAYKAVDLASRLTAIGASVKTIMTQNACELVRPRSFEAVTRSEVFTNIWSLPQEYKIGHISLVEWANVIVIAPATANIIGKIANGICDDLLSTMMCAAHKKAVLIAPAMNNNMWDNPAVQRNVKTIREMKYEMVGPEEGRLACGTKAVGRMSEPQDIIRKIAEMI
ncbi:MAG: flavoprotein [Phycisphaerae bacterium]|jgi:phosphopantothenoylcysteine decarboxylase/phosphopantothenate--cysteine ligase